MQFGHLNMFILAHGAKPAISLENKNLSQADEKPGGFPRTFLLFALY